MDDLQNLLTLPLSNLNKMGFLSTKKISKILFFIISVQILFALLHWILMLLQFIYMDNNIEHYVENVEGVAIYTQFLGKSFSCLYNKNKFLNLIKYTEHFWTTKKCSKTVIQRTNKLSERIRFIQKLFMYLLIAAIILAWIKSIITKQLATGYWSMERDNLFIVAWLTMLIDGTIAVFLIGFFDCLFLGFCYEAIIQCKILYDHLENLSVREITCEYDLKKYYEKMRSCIKHHILLLRYHKELQDIYSIPLLIVYVTSTFFTCIEMYAISEVSNVNSLIIYANYLAIVFIQLTFYCHTANHLTDELSSISNAVYNSDWYSQHFKISRISNVLLIQRAQQKATLTGGGIIVMNIDTLVKLLKFCLSTCITLKGLKN